MVNIIIIEDSEEDYKYLANAIHRYSEQSGEVFSIKRYISALIFLNEYKADADIIFMDIELTDINGVLASEKLRTRDSSVALVFVTNFAHLAIKGYSVSAADFIVKPVNYYKLSALLTKLIKNIKVNCDDYITISTAGGFERISLTRILFIDAEAHRITFHLSDKKVTYSGTLTACEKLLPQQSFVRCYQSYIVNIKYVESCSGEELTLTDGSKIPISRLRKKEVMQKLSAYFTRGKV